MKFLATLLHPQQVADERKAERRAEIYKSLIHWEGQIGGQLFGPVHKGGRREFFCLDENTWVWHEEWIDNGGHHTMTTRYDVRPNAVVKSQGANNYEVLNHQELRNFVTAVLLYNKQILPELDRMRKMGHPARPAK